MEARAKLERARERLLAALAKTRAAGSPRFGEDRRRSNLRLALWLAQESARNLLLRLARGPVAGDSIRAADLTCEELLALAARLQQTEGGTSVGGSARGVAGAKSVRGSSPRGKTPKAGDGRPTGGAGGEPDPA